MSEVARKFDQLWLLRAGQRMLRRCEHGWSPRDVRILLWEAQDGQCLACNLRMTSRLRFPNDGDRDTVDHVHPMGKFGADQLGNLALMHYKCNHRKANRLPTTEEVERLRIVNLKLGWPDRQ